MTRKQKHSVSGRLRYAVKIGRIIKSRQCSRCNKSGTRIEGHHPDHNFPYEVQWLCRSCHRTIEHWAHTPAYIAKREAKREDKIIQSIKRKLKNIMKEKNPSAEHQSRIVKKSEAIRILNRVVYQDAVKAGWLKPCAIKPGKVRPIASVFYRLEDVEAVANRVRSEDPNEYPVT